MSHLLYFFLIKPAQVDEPKMLAHIGATVTVCLSITLLLLSMLTLLSIAGQLTLFQAVEHN